MSRAARAFALLSPPGDGGISVFSCLGSGARQALAPAFRGRREPASAGAGELLYGRLVDASGEPVDEVIVAVLGDELIEVSSHGGIVAAHEVSRRLRELGFEELSPGDLSLRLAGSGESDMLAEATISALAPARTRGQVEFIAGASARLRRRVMAAADAPDDDVASAIESMLEGAGAAMMLAGGARVTLVGPTNSGKSALANALGGRERHIVAEEPNTTRDVVESDADVAGMAVRLADTAGALADPGELGAEGWRRALAAAAGSDLVLLVVDGSLYPTGLDGECEQALPEALVVLNKLDLGLSGAARKSPHPAVSALTGEGVGGPDGLAGRIRRELVGEGGPGLAFDRTVARVLSSALGRSRSGDLPSARRELATLIGLPERA